MNDIKSNFKKMAIALQKKRKNTYDNDKLEPQLIDVLNFSKAHLDKRNELSQCFIDIVNDYRNGPLVIVIFSMRELQWSEVKDAALNRKIASGDPRVWAAMNDVLAVYEDEWEDSDLFKYYSNKTNE